MFGRNPCFENFMKFPQNVFFGVPFNQFEMPNLPPIAWTIAILEIDSAANASNEWLKFLGTPVSVRRMDSTADFLL